MEGGRRESFGQRAGVLTALFAAVVLLAGCNNTLGAERPWFAKSEADGSVRLKSGYWGVADCAPFKSSGASACQAYRVEVAGSELHFSRRGVGPQTDPLSRPIAFIAAPGDPVVIQLELHWPPEWPDKPKVDVLYVYAGFAPTRRDSDGEIIAGQVWPVVCGRAPRPGDDNYGYQDDQGQLTNHPLPGLNMTGDGCTAKDRAALMGAVRATRTMDGSPLKVEWKSPTPPPGKTP